MKGLRVATVVVGAAAMIAKAGASELPTAKPGPSTPAKSSVAVPSKRTGVKTSSTTAAGGGGIGKDLVVNGSFEYPRQDGGWKHMDAPSTELYGWQVSSGNIDLFHVDKGAPNGTQAVDLEGQEAGTIRQALRTVPGARYEVKLCTGCHPIGGGTDKKFFVRAANQAKAWAYDCTGFDGTDRLGWRWVDWQFTAHENVTVLEIGSMRPNGTGSGLIDAVSVVRVGGKKATKAPVQSEASTAPGSSSTATASTSPGATSSAGRSGGAANSKNLIVNGSFEQSPDPKNGWINYALGSTSIFGWKVVLGDLDLWGGLKTPFGSKTIDLQGQQAGAIAQVIPTEVGATYRLKFHVGSYDNLSKKVYARAAGKKQIWPIEVSGSTEQPLLAEVFFDFIPRETKTTIEIGSYTQGTQGPVIDNVSCVRIADPVKESPAPTPAAVQAEPPPAEPLTSAAPLKRPTGDEEEEGEEEQEKIAPPANTTAPPSPTPPR